MQDTVGYAHRLSEKVGNSLGIPVYCYEYAAKESKRKNLAKCFHCTSNDNLLISEFLIRAKVLK